MNIKIDIYQTPSGLIYGQDQFGNIYDYKPEPQGIGGLSGEDRKSRRQEKRDQKSFERALDDVQGGKSSNILDFTKGIFEKKEGGSAAGNLLRDNSTKLTSIIGSFIPGLTGGGNQVPTPSSTSLQSQLGNRDRVVPRPSSGGISTNTMLIGGGVVLAVMTAAIFITRR